MPREAEPSRWQISGNQITGDGSTGFTTRIVGELVLPPVYLLWMYALTQSADGLCSRVFCWRPLRELGKISFSLYTLHFALIHYYAWARASIDGRARRL